MKKWGRGEARQAPPGAAASHPIERLARAPGGRKEVGVDVDPGLAAGGTGRACRAIPLVLAALGRDPERRGLSRDERGGQEHQDYDGSLVRTQPPT